MHKQLLLFFSLFMAVALPASAQSYRQADSARYVADFASLYARSYTEVGNQAPAELLNQCRNQRSPASNQVVVNFSRPVISAADLQRQCGPTSACILEGNVTLDVNASIRVHSLIVRNGATVRWNDNTQLIPNQWMCAGYIVVEENGTWDMNLQDPSKRAWVYIMDNGAVHPGLRSRAFGSYKEVDPLHMGHSMSTGDAEPLPKFSVVGHELKRTWSLLATPLAIGARSMQLMHNPIEMGWRVNDRIAIAPTENMMAGEAQDFVIQSMTPEGVITLSEANSAYREAQPIWTGKDVAALRSAEVINLSRNVIITGDDFREVPCDPSLTEAFPGFGTSTQGCMCTANRRSCTVGLHTANAHAGYSEIANVRVEKCGQRGIEGKYCLHFHHMMDCKNDANTEFGTNCVYRNNAIETSQQRGLIIHSTHNSIVDSNVFYDVRGANLYIEDGNEMLNKVTYNVGMCPWSRNGCTLPGTSNGQADTSENQTGLYMESPNNHLIGNRMANFFNGQFNNAGQGRGPVSQKVCGDNAPFGIWDGNTFHSNGRFGTYLLNGNFPLRDTEQTIANNGTTNNSNNCASYTAGGEDKGLPSLILNHFDYGNNFVGQYDAGDIQYKQHVSLSNANNFYWKETKTTQDGCSAHVSDSYYRGSMDLPDTMGALIIENTTLDNVKLNANHHCNVGVTGYACMGHYILDNVRFVNGSRNEKWVDFYINNFATNRGGIFSLSPTDARRNTPGNTHDFLLPAGYNSVVSSTFSYLLNLGCVTASSLGLGQRYDNGILCPAQLQPLKIFTRDLPENTPINMVLLVTDAATGSPVAEQRIQQMYIQDGPPQNYKSSFSVPVIPGNAYRYRVRLSDGRDIPDDWIIDFGDLTASNRWGVQRLNLEVQGRECGSTISSNHDRRFYMAGNLMNRDFNGWGRGACTQHPSMEATSCLVLPDLERNVAEANYDWRSELGTNCPADCGRDGVCSSTYLGADMPVLSQYACVCRTGWSAGGCGGAGVSSSSSSRSLSSSSRSISSILGTSSSAMSSVPRSSSSVMSSAPRSSSSVMSSAPRSSSSVMSSAPRSSSSVISSAPRSSSSVMSSAPRSSSSVMSAVPRSSSSVMSSVPRSSSVASSAASSAVNVPVGNYGHTVNAGNSVTFYFANAPWVDVHYTVNGQSPMNVRMTRNPVTGMNSFTANNLAAGGSIQYSFTVGRTTGGAYEIRATSFTLAAYGYVRPTPMTSTQPATVPVEFYTTDSTWSDLHYRVNNGPDLNVRMVRDANNTNRFTVQAPYGATITYSFTIGRAVGGAMDTPVNSMVNVARQQ